MLYFFGQDALVLKNGGAEAEHNNYFQFKNICSQWHPLQTALSPTEWQTMGEFITY